MPIQPISKATPCVAYIQASIANAYIQASWAYEVSWSTLCTVKFSDLETETDPLHKDVMHVLSATWCYVTDLWDLLLRCSHWSVRMHDHDAAFASIKQWCCSIRLTLMKKFTVRTSHLSLSFCKTANSIGFSWVLKESWSTQDCLEGQMCCKALE